ncbi:MAG: hypothetical protein JXL81_05560 [Deltaproteobacteria bacterium]|nr:hypothetical protein [Deltaproteobacteria bacterium]
MEITLVCYFKKMKNKKLNFFLIIFSVIILFTILRTPVSALSEKNSDNFSFLFENCTVSDALKQISDKSGIIIILKGELKKDMLTKSYNNRHIDSIISSLLRGENCSIVWNYNNGNLYSVDIHTPDENAVKGRSTGSPVGNGARINNSPVRFPSNMSEDDMDEIRSNYLNSRTINARKRSATPSSRSRTSPENTPARRTGSNYTSGSSGRTPIEDNVGDKPGVSANIRRHTINSQNKKTNNEIEEEIIPPPSPEPPDPEKGSGLERPPMPPGF